METITHYTAYKPKPFTRSEREKVTVLFGGLTWKHERLVQGVMHNLGYKAESLPNVTRDDLDVGKELIDVGACCPTIFTTGNLASFLKKKKDEIGKQELVDNYIFFTAGSCGPCRFGQYQESYAMALDGIGLRDFRMFLMAQNELSQDADSAGLDINLPFSAGLIWAIFCGDLLTDLEYMTRPYEVKPGQTDQVLKESIEYIYEVFRKRPQRGKKWGALAWHILSNYFTDALKQMMKKWDVIEVDRLRVKPKVKITGEFWLQTHEGDGNYNIKRWLEQEQAEVIAPPIAVWIDYLMHYELVKFEESKDIQPNAARNAAIIRGVKFLFRHIYNRLRRSLRNLPQELPDQDELCKLAAPYYHYQLNGGEGHMLVGKALYAYHHKKAHMTCELSPYSCMPNTMSIGAMANVLGKYPDLLYAPIEIKGDAEVHALSRCQMILTEAKKRAQREFEEVLEKTNVSVDKIRAYEAKHPEVRKSTYYLPHYSYAGTSTNYIMHMAKLMK